MSSAAAADAGAVAGECEAQEISVKWNGYSGNLVGAVSALVAAGGGADALTDVTLVAGGRSFPAHRLVLSANSALFRTIFQQTPARDAVVVLHEVPAECVRALLGFMYRGEVRVTEEFLPRLLHAADALRVCGLSAAAGRADRTDSHHHHGHPKVSSSPLPKKRKKENEDVSKTIKKPKETQETSDQLTLRSSPRVPKAEPIESTVSDSAGESTSDSDVPLSHTIKKCSEVSSTQPGPAPVSATAAPASATPASDDSSAFIEKEIENVLQSGAIVESIGATTERTPAATDGQNDKDKGGATYASPSFPCPFCPRVYNSWGYRRRHVKSRHHTNRLSCKWCVCELESTGAWYGHAVRAHGAAHAAARDSLVVLVEAHAVLTLHEPSPAALLRQLDPLHSDHPPDPSDHTHHID